MDRREKRRRYASEMLRSRPTIHKAPYGVNKVNYRKAKYWLSVPFPALLHCVFFQIKEEISSTGTMWYSLGTAPTAHHTEKEATGSPVTGRSPYVVRSPLKA